MRVTCPSCKAIYEAPDEAFGPGGRVVECSGCGARWMQPGPAGAVSEASGRVPGLSAAAESMADLRRPGAGAPEPSPPKARAEPAAPREPQPPAAPPATPPVAPAASSAVTPPPVARPEPATPEPTPPARGPAGSIDPQSLSAQLRGADFEDDDEDERGGGLRLALGFALAVAICGVAAYAYLHPARIAEVLPAAAPALESWAGMVDAARRATEDAYASAAATVATLIERARGLVG